MPTTHVGVKSSSDLEVKIKRFLASGHGNSLSIMKWEDEGRRWRRKEGRYPQSSVSPILSFLMTVTGLTVLAINAKSVQLTVHDKLMHSD